MIRIWVSVSVSSVSIWVCTVTICVPWLSFGICFWFGISRSFSSVVSVTVSIRVSIIATVVSTISIPGVGLGLGLRFCRYNGNNESYKEYQKLHGCQLNCVLQCRLSH